MEADWLWVPCSELPMELISFHYVSKCKNDKIKKNSIPFCECMAIYLFLLDGYTEYFQLVTIKNDVTIIFLYICMAYM
jgi:hypothetical protein